MTTAQRAIRDSAAYTDIIVLEHNADIAAELRDACDGDVDGNDCHEFWGTADGADWRIHVLHPVQW